MKIVIFGLTVSSSWGNGHATLWRGLLKALKARGHAVVFYEKDVPYYAANRDVMNLPHPSRLRLYESFSSILAEAREELSGADVGMTTSYCPDGREAAALLLDSRAAIKVFYDLDTPVTLERLRAGGVIDYLPLEGLAAFDLVLSYTGGKALQELETCLGARAVAPLYGSVDPDAHFPVPVVEEYRSDLSYLGTYAAERQAALEELFLEPARLLPTRRFVMGGAQYPTAFPWTKNIFFVRHMPPALHPAFFCSSRATLNVTRRSMAEYGYCPSGRLFEAAACGVPLLTDRWEGLDEFFEPGSELLTVDTAQQVAAALERSDDELTRMARAARERTLACHTAQQRVADLEALCASLPSPAGAH